MGQAPRRRGLHPLGPGKIPLPGLRSFRRGSSPEKGTLPFACSVASALATARGRYHLFPGGGRGVTRLDERPGFGIAFLALAENPAEGGGGVWRPGAARRAAPGLPNKRARPGPLAPGALFQGASRPAAAPPGRWDFEPPPRRGRQGGKPGRSAGLGMADVGPGLSGLLQFCQAFFLWPTGLHPDFLRNKGQIHKL